MSCNINNFYANKRTLHDQFTKQNLIDERLLFHKNLLQNHGYMGPKQAMFFVKIGKFGVLYFGRSLEFGTDSFETSHKLSLILNLGGLPWCKNL